MKIVILEDVQDQMDWLVAEVEEKFGDIEIEQIATEHEFQQRVPDFQKNPPDAFILDIMVRYTNPGKNIPKPPAEKYYRAGMRCRQQIRDAGIDSPIILYSILESNDLRDDLQRLDDVRTKFIPKTTNTSELFLAILRKIN